MLLMRCSQSAPSCCAARGDTRADDLHWPAQRTTLARCTTRQRTFHSAKSARAREIFRAVEKLFHCMPTPSARALKMTDESSSAPRMTNRRIAFSHKPVHFRALLRGAARGQVKVQAEAAGARGNFLRQRSPARSRAR
jgi:hypothetical protein